MSKFIRYSIITLSIALASTLIFWLVYGFEMRLDYISNSIFVIAISVLCVSVIMFTGATRVFLGFSYTSKMWLNSKKTKEEYGNFKEYYDEKSPSHKKDTLDIIVICLIYILVAIFLISI